ncbi:MAG: HEAT repeat domain-containing protein [Elusimicrobiota bacterium]
MPLLSLLALLFLPSFGAAQQPSTAAVTVPVDPYQAAVEKLKNPDPQLRRQAIEELAAGRDPRAVARLTTALEDPHVFVRAAAVDNLGLLRAPVAANLIELLKPEKEKEAAVRRSAATALAYLADPMSADSLISALKDSDLGVRYSAVRALGVLRVPQSTEALAGFLHDPEVGMRRTVIAALGQIRDPASVGVFLGALQDGDVYVRLEAVKVLGVMAGAAAAAGLRSALSDRDISVGLQAALALASQGSSEGMAVALEAVKQDKSIVFRRQAATLLGAVGDASVAAAMSAALKAEKDPATRALLEAAGKQIKSRLAVKPAAPSRRRKP